MTPFEAYQTSIYIGAIITSIIIITIVIIDRKR